MQYRAVHLLADLEPPPKISVLKSAAKISTQFSLLHKKFPRMLKKFPRLLQKFHVYSSCGFFTFHSFDTHGVRE